MESKMNEFLQYEASVLNYYLVRVWDIWFQFPEIAAAVQSDSGLVSELLRFYHLISIAVLPIILQKCDKKSKTVVFKSACKHPFSVQFTKSKMNGRIQNVYT